MRPLLFPGVRVLLRISYLVSRGSLALRRASGKASVQGTDVMVDPKPSI
jgi:hypothetical protein